MAGSIGIITGMSLSKAGVTCMARIVGNLAIPITPATINAITFNVQDLNLATSSGNGSLVVANAIFPALVTNDPRWDKDSAAYPGKDGLYGYNFLAAVPSTMLTAFDTQVLDPAGQAVNPANITPHTFQIDFLFTPVTGDVFKASYQTRPIPTWP